MALAVSLTTESLSMWPAPKLLCGTRVSLLPLSHTHATGLCMASKAQDHMPKGCRIPPAHDIHGEVSYLLERQADGLALPYAIQASGDRILGISGFSHIDRAHKRLEIGGTWLAKASPAEFTEMMVMLLTYGFQIAKAATIQMRAPADHAAHRQLLSDLGAQLDGILRGETVAKDGTPQDIAVYSIIMSEWSNTRDVLLAKLQ